MRIRRMIDRAGRRAALTNRTLPHLPGLSACLDVPSLSSASCAAMCRPLQAKALVERTEHHENCHSAIPPEKSQVTTTDFTG